MFDLQAATEAATDFAADAFPEDEWVLKTVEWRDGSFEVKAAHTIGETVNGVMIQEEFRVTPFIVENRVVEGESGHILESVVVENPEAAQRGETA